MIVHFPVLTGASSLFDTIEKKTCFTSLPTSFTLICSVKSSFLDGNELLRDFILDECLKASKYFHVLIYDIKHTRYNLLVFFKLYCVCLCFFKIFI